MGLLNWCVWFALNDIVEKDSYRLFIMREIIDATRGQKGSGVTDLKESFHQIEIADDAKEKTAFQYKNKVYQWRGMVMGYKNSAIILQKVMIRCLEMKWE